ncbi:MAG: nickel-responsive transcriptional regulator NikR [Kiritimatiellia bacterium]|nr:nickel-responsive transcriptional regulator NikR [Lentisphaerota bacterium]
MSLIRFSVSLDRLLLEKFDRKIRGENCPTRSKAVGDLIRNSLVEEEWLRGDEVAGAIVLVYDHHRPNLMRELTERQHKHHALIISTQHMHLDHDNCLEIVAVRGQPRRIKTLVQSLQSVKGLKHVNFACATTGRRLA